MWNPFKKKSDEIDFFIETNEVPASTLYRWFLYDGGTPNPNKYAATAGFSPISAEGEEMEMRDSERRLARVLPYKSFLEMMSVMNGTVLAEAMVDVLKAEGVLDEDAEFGEDELKTMAQIYAKVSHSVLVPAFAAALALGIIVNPGAFTSEDMYE